MHTGSAGYTVRRLETLVALPLNTASWNTPRWHPAQTHTIVHFDSNEDTVLRLQFTNATSGETETVFTFPAPYERIRGNQSFDEISRDGRWLAAGGIEWAFPVEEHGLNEWRPWAYELEEKEGWVAITVSDLESRTGMLVGTTISLDADHSYLTISFWWIAADDTQGVSSFFSNGAILYHFDLTALGYQQMVTSRDFWSPDGQTVVVNFRHTGSGEPGEMAVMAYRDGRPPVILLYNLRGMGYPYWSPDSQFVVFTQVIEPDTAAGTAVTIDLDMLNLAGETVWRNSPFFLDPATMGRNMIEWLPCRPGVGDIAPDSTPATMVPQLEPTITHGVTPETGSYPGFIACGYKMADGYGENNMTVPQQR